MHHRAAAQLSRAPQLVVPEGGERDAAGRRQLAPANPASGSLGPALLGVTIAPAWHPLRGRTPPLTADGRNTHAPLGRSARVVRR